MWSVFHKIHPSLFHMYTFISHVAVGIFSGYIHPHISAVSIICGRTPTILLRIIFQILSFCVCKYWYFINMSCCSFYHQFKVTKTKLVMKLDYRVCPTRYRTRHFFNNFTTNEDIATKFEADLHIH
jgi:hypothetical protein